MDKNNFERVDQLIIPIIRTKRFRVTFYNENRRPIFAITVPAAISDIAVKKAEREVPKGLIYRMVSVMFENEGDGIDGRQQDCSVTAR